MLGFATHFPEMFLWAIPIIVLGGIALFVLYWVFVLFLLVILSVFYAVQGRWKEFSDRLDNDPSFLTFDKDTGKFNW